MRIQLFSIAILGLLVSGYLFITYTTGAPIVCVVTHGCEVVRASEYARLFGLPTPLYGLFFYSLLAMTALFSTKKNSFRMKLPILVLTSAGALISAWLTYLEAFIIEAWCIWCVASALLAFAAFFLVIWSLVKEI